MRIIISTAVCAVLLSVCASVEAKDQTANSVVKIHVTRREPDFLRPWNKGASAEGAGSGVIIEGKRILTNAHVVMYASQIFVQADQSTERVPAKVTAIAPGIDMAIVEVDNASFFDNRPPLQLAAGIPAKRQTVSVYGYPIGGEQISVTQGIVSRIECTYIYCSINGLRIQIDAALNPGNSGGPAVADGKIIGLVYSKFAQGENIGYLLAAEEIQMFLDDIKSGSYHGKPHLWTYLHTTENEALRARLGLTKETGVVVCTPLTPGPDSPLKKWDVIMRVGDVPVDNMGDVTIKDDLRVAYQYLIPKLAKNGTIKLTVFRDRKTIEVQAPVSADGNYVIPFLMNKYPRYFIYGPMVFMTASKELTTGLASTAAASLMIWNKNPLLSRNLDHPAFPGEEIVLLSYLLPHRTSKGYSPQPFSVVTHINGAEVRNLAHLVELLRDAKGEFLTVDLAGLTLPLVFRREEVLKATEDILSDEAIRKQCSSDLESVWSGKK